MDLEHLIVEKVGLSEEHCREFSGLLKEVHLRNKEFLMSKGTVCNFIGIVKEGVLRSFTEKQETEFNLGFYLPNSFVSSYTSLLTRTPGSVNIQALSDATICLISNTDFEALLKKSNDWYKLGKYISDNLYIRKCKRQTSLLINSSTEGYNLLLKTYPGIEQLVAQYHIASYLGIKPESLSRIKSLTYIKK